MAKAIKAYDRSVTPYRSPSNRGYFIMCIDLTFLQKLIEETRIGMSGEIFFTDIQGNILIQKAYSKIASKLPQNLAYPLNDRNRNKESSTTILNGKKWVLQTKGIHSSFVLVAGLPDQELFSAGNKLGYIVVATLITTAVLVAIAIFTALKFLFIQPIKKLHSAIDEIRRGNLQTPVDIQSSDELGKLANAFNKMSANLFSVQQQIAERTDALSKANQELKSAHKAMVEAKESAEIANEAKSTFLSRMSHELRTPLNAILGFAQLMESDPGGELNESHRENVLEILKAGHHLLKLINEVLDLSRIETGHLQLSFENIQLENTVDSVESIMQPLARQHQVTLVTQIQPTPNRYLHADPVRLKQILINLVSNGVKYNRKHGTVTLSVKSMEQHWFRFEVVDQGMGFSTEQQEKLFQPFERIEMDHSEVEGTGIGLVIAMNLVKMMDGRIGVDSIPGVGSTFWVELPASNESFVSKGQ